MKALFVKIFVVMAFLIAGFELAFGFVLPRLLDNAHDSYIDRWTGFYKEKGKNTELICLGSSRIHRHCNPKIIADKTGKSTEVIATAGAKIKVLKALYADYVKRNGRPHVLLVGIDFTGLDSTNILPHPQHFVPGPERSDASVALPQLNLLRYHKSLGYFYYKDALFHILESPDREPHQKGFAPRDIAWDNTMNDLIENKNGITFPISDATVNEIMEFIAGETKRGIHCLGVIAPEYYEIWPYQRNRDEARGKIVQAAKVHGVRILNFSDSSYRLCFNKDMFYNSQHLNAKGADVYSADLADSVNHILNSEH